MNGVQVLIDGEPVTTVRMFHARVEGVLWHGRDPDAWMETHPEPEASVLAEVAMDSPLGRRLDALVAQETPVPVRLVLPRSGLACRFDTYLAATPAEDGVAEVQIINAGPVVLEGSPKMEGHT